MPDQAQHSADQTPGEHFEGVWHEVWTSEPFAVVLALVFCSFVFVAAAPDTDWTMLIKVLLQGATLLAAVRAAQMSKSILRAAAVVVGIATISTLVAVAGAEQDLAEAFSRIVSLLLVAVVPFAIGRSVVRSILRHRRITLQAVFGVVSIYLLVGMFFSFLYGAIGTIGDGSFFASGAAEDPQNFQYFSFATLTTVGYGDFTAAGQFGRTLAIVEALLGQLYLITVLSLFVGNLRPRSHG